MNNRLFESLIQVGATVLVAVAVLIVLVLAASSTSIGRSLLPKAVIDAATRLLPQMLISDAELTKDGDFRLRVKGAAHIKTIQVHQGEESTTTWAFDAKQHCPQSGTFAFIDLGHNMGSASDTRVGPDRVQEHIESALGSVLSAKKFVPSEPNSADLLVRGFVALEDTESVVALRASSDPQHTHDWQLALETAQKHGGVAEPDTIASGSIMLFLTDARTGALVWRAASVGKIVVGVSENERSRRIHVAVAGMLKRFPPPPA